MGTKSGQWYTVKCSQPLEGSTIKLVTTQNTWLQINGIELTGSRIATATPAITLSMEAPTQSTTYSAQYTPVKVLSGGLSITKNGVGEWW